VANCNGFTGPKSGNNAIVKQALATARAVAKKIKCIEGCPVKDTTLIWKGWDCGNNPLTAVAAVELRIDCHDFDDECDDDDGPVG
jgi:hypothetical protein